MAEDRGPVLVIAPHADDEVLGCGGAIQDHVRQGRSVYEQVVSNRVIEHREDAEYIATTTAIDEGVAREVGLEDLLFSGLQEKYLYSYTYTRTFVPRFVAFDSVQTLGLCVHCGASIRSHFIKNPEHGRKNVSWSE